MHYSPGRRGLQPRTGKRARLQSAPTGFLLCLSPPITRRERARLQSAPTGFGPRLSPQGGTRGRDYKARLRNSGCVRAKNDKKKGSVSKDTLPA